MVRMTWQWLCLEIRVIKGYYWLIAVTMFCLVYWISKKISSKKDALARGAFAVYLFLIIVSTVINRGISSETFNFVPFRALRMLLLSGKRDVIPQAFLNIILFLPFGFLNAIVVRSFYKNKSKRFCGVLTVLSGTLLSIVIEAAQLIMHRGLCETDDVIHNTLGTAIGYGFWLLTIKVSGSIVKTRNKRLVCR